MMRALRYIKLIANIKEVINSHMVIGDFNIQLTSMDRSSNQKINKEIVA